MQDFKKLIIWQKAHKFTLDIYNLVKNFPKEEKYRLVDQLIRASYSIPTNIAEGSGRISNVDFNRFLFNAIDSANEVEYQLILLKDLGIITLLNYTKLNAQLILIRKMIYNLCSKLN